MDDLCNSSVQLMNGYFIESVSIAAIDANNGQYDMDIPCSDPCPKCTRPMKVGDYVCWGHCRKCYIKDINGNQL